MSILSPAQIKQLYIEKPLSLHGKFDRGLLDLHNRSMHINSRLLPGTSIAGWFKMDHNNIHEPVLVSANGLSLVRNKTNIAASVLLFISV